MSLNFTPLFNIDAQNFPLGERGLRSFESFSHYYKLYYGDCYNDLSFAVVLDNDVLGYILCTTLDHKLTTPDGGIEIILSPHLSIKDQKTITTKIIDHLHGIAKTHACSHIIIKDQPLTSSLSSLGTTLFNQRFESRLTFEMNIPFSNFSEEKFRASLRKSYKSLLNWGKNNLNIQYINKENLNSGEFKCFQDFHHKISGKITRSQDTWDQQYNMLKDDLGELILATYNDQLAAGSFFADFGEKSIYFTGVYERDLFDFGISHFLLYEGIIRSYRRKYTSKFSLGYFDTDIKDEKWYNIQFFKKGFCTELTPTIFWSKCIKNE